VKSFTFLIAIFDPLAVLTKKIGPEFLKGQKKKKKLFSNDVL